MTERNPNPSPATRPGAGRLRTAAICAAILLVGVVLTIVVFMTEPQAQRLDATRRTPMLVDVTTVTRGDHRPVFQALGTIEAEQDVVLRPRVGGEVIARATAFDPGGIVARGDTLLRLDPADYEIALEQARGALAEAGAELEIELGRRRVAELDYELLDEVDPLLHNEALVLREPQSQAARARAAAAEAAVRRAELDLARTVITAPFDAHVLAREVNVGSQVDAGDVLGRLVGLEAYRVAATLPRDRLHWLDFADATHTGAAVRIVDRSAWPAGAFREGRLQQPIGALDTRTRLARVLVRVSDPLARRADTTGPPLVIGAFVAAAIEGRLLEQVVRLERDLVRREDTVWVMEGDSLRVRDVQIEVRDDAYAYVSAGLTDGDKVVTTNLTTVSDGAALRLRRDDEPDNGGAEGGR